MFSQSKSIKTRDHASFGIAVIFIFILFSPLFTFYSYDKTLRRFRATTFKHTKSLTGRPVCAGYTTLTSARSTYTLYTRAAKGGKTTMYVIWLLDYRWRLISEPGAHARSRGSFMPESRRFLETTTLYVRRVRPFHRACSNKNIKSQPWTCLQPCTGTATARIYIHPLRDTRFYKLNKMHCSRGNYRYPPPYPAYVRMKTLPPPPPPSSFSTCTRKRGS